MAAAGAISLAALVPDDSWAASRKRTPRKPKITAVQCPAEGSQTVAFAKALNGTSFMTQDGREIRLAGIMAPADAGEVVPSTTTDAARDSLARVLKAGSVTLAATDRPDRYGRVVAQVFAGGVWVQGRLLNDGVARAAPDRASDPCGRQLAQAEDEARTAQAGHWHDGVFALRAPEQLRGRVGTFQVVEGVVTTSGANKGRAYINFGANYKTDFTVTVGQDDLKLFRQMRFDVKKLAGKHVRVYGWVEQFNGPEMEISTPTAIQVLDEPAPEIAEKTAKVEKPAKSRVVAEKKKRVRTKKTASTEKPAKKQVTTGKKKRTRKKKAET